jgi:shikimate kinase
MRIYLIGFMGAGKTHTGKILSKKLNVPFFDLDDLIESNEQKTIPEIFDLEGEEYFRTVERDLLYEITEAKEAMVLSCGGGAPCFFNNIDYMNQNGITVWIDTPYDILLGRLRAGKSKRPLLKDLTDEQLKAYILKKSADRRIFYERAKLKLDQKEILIDDIVKILTNE